MKKAKFISIIVLSVTLLVGCQKDDEVEVLPQTSEAEKGSNDETARDEYDGSIDDVFKTLENTGLQTGRSISSGGVILPCGVVRIDSTGGVYRFVYDSSSNCNNRVLSGSVSASLISGTTWSDVGAELQLTYTNYRIYFSVNGQILTFNGSLIVKNVNGGKLYNVLSIGGKQVITHTIHGSIQITFDVNDTRTWTISKKRIYQSSDGTIGGITWSLDADGNVAEIGTTKSGDPFTTTFPTPILWENCSPTGTLNGPFKATTGELVYTAGLNSMTAEAGYAYNISSKRISQVNDCSSEGYKLTFKINGRTSVSFQYY